MPADSGCGSAQVASSIAEVRFSLGTELFELRTLRTQEDSLPSPAITAVARGSGALAWVSRPGSSLEVLCSPGLRRRVDLGGDEDVLSFGWTDEEMLVVVGRSGRLRVFEVNGAEVLSLDLGSELGVEGGVQVERLLLAPDGCACLTSARRTLVVEGLSQLDASLPQLYELPCEAGLSQHHVLCCALSMAEGVLRVLFALNDSSLLVCDRFYVDRIDLAALHSMASPLLIALSPSGRFLACWTGQELVILNASFDAKVN